MADSTTASLSTPGRRMSNRRHVRFITARRSTSAAGGSSSAASLVAILVVPQALARLERLLAATTGVRPRVRVRPLVCADRRHVLKAFTTLDRPR